MTINQSWYHLRIPSLLFVLLLIGCESKGVRLDGLVPGSGDGVSSLTTGDTNGCEIGPCPVGVDWNNSYITPNSLTVAMKSAKLINTLDTDPTPCSDTDPTPCYTIFDTGDISKPIIQTFLPGTTQTFHVNTDSPTPNESYDRIRYEISYYEMVIPIQYTGQPSSPHRVRLYLAKYQDAPNSSSSQQVFKSDILMDTNSGILAWLDPNNGNFFLTRPQSETGAYQVPTNQLAVVGNGGVDDINTTADNFTFTVPLAAPLSVPSDPKDQFTIEITFDTTKEFFFDDTDNTATCHETLSPLCDVNNSFNNTGFNFQLNTCSVDQNTLRTNGPCDGRLDAAVPRADFWPGLPGITAKVK